ncbi:hypothetical protein CC85DRAFT_124435 [Cutaneotrichosporon oleaginosum]|uniref:Uncharacterized protein n=1 Tax=Cutaneotrichosporon oleaginosum TaxID=879819 RepID=A0A0J0XJZ9_9TREE|nr:uncharacterized protein CC85DRAFT_124435 [Cutaneotrichosporon oleaginosum]KLT41403.1 hypothetical protein CC85DRAFT_124435 [Cutaneotrichosporon oleaginosum]TXT06344.1 hypothetical protein COLE_05675 [Cutaneotrichosporon oleaginosum]
MDGKRERDGCLASSEAHRRGTTWSLPRSRSGTEIRYCRRQWLQDLPTPTNDAAATESVGDGSHSIGTASTTGPRTRSRRESGRRCGWREISPGIAAHMTSLQPLYCSLSALSTTMSAHPSVIILIASDGASHTFVARELRHWAPRLAGPHGYIRELSDTSIEGTKTLEAFAALVSYGTLDSHHGAGLFALLAFLEKWAPALVDVFARQVVHAVWRRDHALHPQLAVALLATAGKDEMVRQVLFLAPLELGLGDEDGERRDVWDSVPRKYREAIERATEAAMGATDDEKLDTLVLGFDEFFKT